MIRFTVIGQKEVVATLGRVSGEVRRRVRTAIGRLTLRLERRIKEQKLSGQVLRVRTGTLRRSVSSVVVSNPAVVVGTVSTNVEYARVHEFGFDGTVTVREHMRTVKQAFGRPLKTPKTVRVAAHSMRMRVPERSFMRSALREMSGEVDSVLRAAVGGRS